MDAAPSPAPAELAGTFKLHKNNEEALSRHFFVNTKTYLPPIGRNPIRPARRISQRRFDPRLAREAVRAFPRRFVRRASRRFSMHFKHMQPFGLI